MGDTRNPGGRQFGPGGQLHPRLGGMMNREPGSFPGQMTGDPRMGGPFGQMGQMGQMMLPPGSSFSGMQNGTGGMWSQGRKGQWNFSPIETSW